MSAIFGEILNFGQRSGPEITLRVFGDEHYARYENLDGFSAIYDDQLGLFCYARLSAGSFRSTGTPLSEQPPQGLVRHLQETQDIIAARAAARKLRRSAMAGGQREAAVVRTFGPNQGLLEGRVLSQGPVKGLTILVNFQDITSTSTKADVDAMLNGTNYTANGNICSAREYFDRVSSGKLNYTNVVVGPYTLSREREFYVNNLLVEEALQLAVAAGLNLKQFDSRNQNIVDALNIMYAGQTQYRGELWPHNWHIDLRFGTMKTDLYLLTSLGRTPADLSIGTFCHENGHLLCRFPDMYDYGERDGDSIKSAGIGSYCLMGSGNHNDSGRSPSPVCAYLRDLAGWCDNVVDLNTAAAHQATHGDYNTVMKYRTSKPNEYFLVENRTKMNLDRGLPASGLAVYHCDIDGSNELQQGTPDKHYQCALLQADGRRDLELDVNRGDGSDLYGATQGLALTSSSSPHSREWDGRDSGLAISDIGAPGSMIAFKVGAAPAAVVATGKANQVISIPDAKATGVASAIAITQSGIVAQIKVNVDIQHTYIGDLRVVLTSPGGRSTVLHPQLGGSADNLIATYNSAVPGVLSAMVGQSMKGNWILNVSDRVRADVGKLRGWGIELRSGPAQAPAVAAPAPAKPSAPPRVAVAKAAPAKRKTNRARARP
jgi:M6 family metalloprotease-like protein